MKDTSNLHQKVQELCDCYATTDPLKQMSEVKNEKDTDEAALKWVALAVLHGLNSNASKISLSRTDGGGVAVTAEYRTSELPSPGSDIGAEVIQAVKGITHLEGESGKTALAFGFRDNSFELKIKLKKEGGQEKVTISFPE
jgi:hypothetical protein